MILKSLKIFLQNVCKNRLFINTLLENNKNWIGLENRLRVFLSQEMDT